MTPDGYSAQDVPACSECGAVLHAEFVDITDLGRQRRRYALSTLRCPTSRFHDVAAAYESMTVVMVAHPDREDTGSCTLLSLDRWRKQGWYPVAEEYQTPTEMVHARVRQLAGEHP